MGLTVLRLRQAFVLLVAALVVLAGCDDASDSPTAPSSLTGLQLQDVVIAVAAQDVQAIMRPGLPPAPNGGPTVTVSGNQSVVNGGTLTASVAAASPFQTVYIYVGSRTVGLATEAAGGIDGYYELRLPSPQSDASLLLAFPQSIPLGELELLFAVADPRSAVGPFVGLSATVTSVGTGDVQVTLSWDADSDVDLHVVDPAGEEIYYAHRRSASGGELDLDSNAGCAIDGVRNENITWPIGRAPRGQYTVRVDYWDSCGVARTNYTVRVNSGGNVQIFTGSFTGAGDRGGLGSGRLITVFERASGPMAAPFTGASAAAASPPAAGRGNKTAAAPRR
jgi:uncharacterized protein YfaP (DUF2135 family)